MSAPITETHRALVEKLGDLLDTEEMIGSSPAEQAAQLIADSEAQAVVAAHAVTAVYAERDQLRNELADETNLHAQTRTVVEFLNTICTDLRNAGGPPFIRSEAIRLLREDQATLRAEVELGEQLQAATEASLKTVSGERDQLRAEVERLKFYIATTIQPDEYAKVIKDLRAEVERLKRDYEYDHKCLHEVRERCELWKQRAERAEAAMERLSEWQAGVIENARAHHAQLKDAIARAERAEAELAADRARLDWLEKRGPWESWNGFGETGITLRENIRAAIDAAMKEGK
jgi:chromosome segregation ATPase